MWTLRWAGGGILRAAVLALELLSGLSHKAEAQTKPELGRRLFVSPAALSRIPAERQFRRLSAAAAAALPGDTVIIHSGVYREAVVVRQSGTNRKAITFEAAPGANVIVTGADRLTNLRPDAGQTGQKGLYTAQWPYPLSTPHPDDERHRLIGRAEQVFVNGYALRQVLRREEMAPGAFFVDAEAKRLYLWDAGERDLSGDPNGTPRVEASVRPVLWENRGDYVTLRGIRFRYAANRAQQGAVQLHGAGARVENCRFERTNGIGAAFFGMNQAAVGCAFVENGQMGFAAVRAHHLRMTDCLIRGNNVKDWERDWEAGGDKIVLTKGMIIEKSQFLENRGVGLWFDIGNEDCVVRHCLIADNEAAGIFYEISYGLYAHDNVIIGNGFDAGGGAWGANGGISLSSSSGCRLERNLIFGNKEGLQFREQERTTPRIADAEGAKERPIWNERHVIRDNLLAHNQDVQIAGWFDVSDERHFPRALQTATPAKMEGNAPAADIAAKYGAKDSVGQSVNLSLETLHLTVDGNQYVRNGGEGLFRWGTTWRRHLDLKSRAELVKTLGFERSGAEPALTFADPPARDFRLSASLRAYPQGSVPGVRLGALTAKKGGVPSQ